MKYHSRSPEEWKKIDEEKLKSDKTSELRKRSLMFLFVNFVMVIAVILMVRIYQVVSPASRGAVGPFRVYIKMPDEFDFGQPIDAQVKILNTRKTRQKLRLMNFALYVEDERGDVEYSFSQGGEIETVVDPLSYVLVFDLAREVKLDDLPAGLHRIRVSLTIDGKETTVIRTFRVVRRMAIYLGGYQPFLFVGEIPEYRIGITNPTFSKIEVSVKSVEVKLLSENGKVLSERNFFLDERLEIPPGETVGLVEYAPGMSFNAPSIYNVDIVMKTDIGDLKEEFGFSVITRDQLSIRDTRFYIETPIQLTPGESFDVEVYLYNDGEENRYVLVDSFVFSIVGKSYVFTDSSDGLRIWIPPRSKESVYSKSGLVLRDSGKYEMLVLMKTPSGNLSKKLYITVGGE